jgi:hypothetical protein
MATSFELNQAAAPTTNFASRYFISLSLTDRYDVVALVLANCDARAYELELKGAMARSTEPQVSTAKISSDTTETDKLGW